MVLARSYCRTITGSALKSSAGTRWDKWLRHCGTSREFVVSIPDGVFGIIPWLNPSDRTTAMGSTQPLTEMSTRNLPWKVKADNLTTFMCRLSRKYESLNLLSRPVQGQLYLYLYWKFSVKFFECTEYLSCYYCILSYCSAHWCFFPEISMQCIPEIVQTA